MHKVSSHTSQNANIIVFTRFVFNMRIPTVNTNISLPLYPTEHTERSKGDVLCPFNGSLLSYLVFYKNSPYLEKIILNFEKFCKCDSRKIIYLLTFSAQRRGKNWGWKLFDCCREMWLEFFSGIFPSWCFLFLFFSIFPSVVVLTLFLFFLAWMVSMAIFSLFVLVISRRVVLRLGVVIMVWCSVSRCGGYIIHYCCCCPVILRHSFGCMCLSTKIQKVILSHSFGCMCLSTNFHPP